MGIKAISLATTALVLSTSANASIISIDWQSSGDNLITRDTVSGLDWLDLTETNGMSHIDVNAQLGTGGHFEGYRYATNLEVVALWANFGVDLSEGATTYAGGYVDSGVIQAVGLLGNIQNEYNELYSYGVQGMTNETYTYNSNYFNNMGAYIHTYGNTTYFPHEPDSAFYHTSSQDYMGSYLVAPSAVPIPTAVWLFGSGLIGLISVARRKKT